MFLGPNTLSVDIPLADTQAYTSLCIIRMHIHMFFAYNHRDIRNSAPDSSAIIYKPRDSLQYTGCT